MLPSTNCSGKFLEPTVIDLLALAEFFSISWPPPPLLDVLLPPELLLLESSLPHAATVTASASTSSAARTARIFLLMWVALPVVDLLRTCYDAQRRCPASPSGPRASRHAGSASGR